ncbi:MAG: YeeE/YedE family protein [Pseudomonadota bacterium]
MAIEGRAAGERAGSLTLRAIAPIAAAGLGLAAIAWAAASTGPEASRSARALSVFIGAAGGIALYHAAFGFTGAWRRVQREGRAAGLRAQLLLLAFVIIASYPLIALTDMRPWVFPIGLASAIGAAMFGVGMQLAGGCGSGVLFTLGGGSTRMILALGAFLAGSALWVGTRQIWADLPTFGRASLIAEFGAPIALAATLLALALLWRLSLAYERARCGDIETPKRTGSLWRGPWSRALGAAVLAGVVIACFLTLGRPWGITAAYPLWAGQIAEAAGLPIRSFGDWRSVGLDRSVFEDATSVMNFGVMLGALGAAGLAGAFAPRLSLTGRDALTAIVGGLLMGYGARLAYGCNVGGFIGGIASASLHGWWWLLFGALGSFLGVALRERLGMDPPRR